MKLKRKTLRGLSALYDGLKGPWWGSRKPNPQIKDLPHSFLRSGSCPEQWAFHLSPTTSSSPWLTSMVKLADHKQRGQTSKCQGVGDDWHIISLWKNIEFSLFWSHIYAMTLFSLSLPPFFFFFYLYSPKTTPCHLFDRQQQQQQQNYLSKLCAFMLNCARLF